ncbi:Uncharacterised protein [Zhongshania aliphaticivorans]|uniref:Uncharacterized protein n=1 Tax=Zhongshania aliphaticivorans TaxID=1470434 RepID=A0A5S9MXY2_9GAMM|nr:hypothetical protein [Zhongshania aliphaticivorans]CAA0081060.1 Uncharacterised protein [Zhongshania aliphaticivorans]CAA0085155.1 Uncharacterised protein [Zhongshania aliphaticivorans]
MKLKTRFTKALVTASILALPLFTAASRVNAQAEFVNFLSLTDGPLAVLYTPLGDLGILPAGIENLDAIVIAGSDILLAGDNPLDTVLGLGGPLKGQLIPIFDVLVEDPLSTVDYILEGGTIISEGLTIIPTLPLLNSPLIPEM